MFSTDTAPILANCPASWPCDPTPCSSDYAWQNIVVGEKITITQNETVVTLRAFITDPVGYRIFIVQTVGDVDVGVRFSSPFPLSPISFGTEVGDADNAYWTGYLRTPKEGCDVCPEDAGYALGTMHIQLSCFEPSLCLYDIILEKVGESSTGPRPSACAGVNIANHTCIEDGIDTNFTGIVDVVGGQETYLVYPVPDDACDAATGKILMGISIVRPYWSFYFVAFADQPYPWKDFTPPEDRGSNDTFTLSRPVPFWTQPGVQGSTWATFSFDCATAPKTWYITVYTLFQLGPESFPPKIVIQSRKDYLRPVPINDLPEYSFSWFMPDTLYLSCPNNITYHSCLTARFVTDAGGGGEKCSQNIQFAKRTEHTNILWPPSPLQDFQLLVLPILDPPSSPPLGNGLVVLFLLELGLQGSSTASFASWEDISQCTLEMNGVLMNSDFVGYTGSVTATQASDTCNFTAFINQKNYLDDLLVEIGNATKVVNLLRLQLDVDGSSLDNSLTDCYTDTDSSFFSSENRTVFEQQFGCYDPTNTSDPFCTNLLQLSECCAPKEQLVYETYLNSSGADPAVWKKRGCDEACTESFTSELAIVREPNRCSNPQTTVTELTRTTTNFWISCWYQVFGRDSKFLLILI